jgi:hypothetical protein
MFNGSFQNINWTLLPKKIHTIYVQHTYKQKKKTCVLLCSNFISSRAKKIKKKKHVNTSNMRDAITLCITWNTHQNKRTTSTPTNLSTQYHFSLFFFDFPFWFSFVFFFPVRLRSSFYSSSDFVFFFLLRLRCSSSSISHHRRFRFQFHLLRSVLESRFAFFRVLRFCVFV